jgi:hypothetical protein
VSSHVCGGTGVHEPVTAASVGARGGRVLKGGVERRSRGLVRPAVGRRTGRSHRRAGRRGPAAARRRGPDASAGADP